MTPTSNIFLVGPMGAGKTTIGRRLAKSLKRTFIDSDHELEKRTGASIALIFDVEGEEGFRKRETSIIEELSKESNIVLATGGGAVIGETNRKALAERGFVVYLTAPIEQLLDRTRRDTNRPLLNTDDPAGKMKTLMEQRDPLYRDVADLIIDTGSLNLGDVVRRIRTACP